jgi:hypothetical protein
MVYIAYVHHTAGLGLTTLRMSVYAKDGTRHENPDLTLAEKGTTGVYIGASANIVAGDDVRAYDTGSPTITLAGGEYQPPNSELSADLVDIEAKLDLILSAQMIQKVNVDQSVKPEKVVILQNL